MHQVVSGVACQSHVLGTVLFGCFMAGHPHLLLIGVAGFGEQTDTQDWRVWAADWPRTLLDRIVEYFHAMEWRCRFASRAGGGDPLAAEGASAAAGLHLVLAPVQLTTPGVGTWLWKPSQANIPLRGAVLCVLPQTFPPPIGAGSSAKHSTRALVDTLGSAACHSLWPALDELAQSVIREAEGARKTRDAQAKKWRALQNAVSIWKQDDQTQRSRRVRPRVGAPSEVPPTDPCQLSQVSDVGTWLHTPCDDMVVRFGPRTVLRSLEPDGELIMTLRHDEKFVTLSAARRSHVSWDLVMRASLDPDDGSKLRVLARASDLAGQRGREQQDTLRFNLVWICNVTKFLQGRGNWDDGTIHVVLHAPQTSFGWQRMEISPALKPVKYGQPGDADFVIVALGFIGPTVFGFDVLRGVEKSGSLSLSPPARQALRPQWRPLQGADFSASVASGQTTDGENLLHAILQPEAFFQLPQVLMDKLDREQKTVLLAMGEARSTAFSIEAYAGTGKSQLLKALLWLWCSAESSRVALFTLQSRTLRHEFTADLAVTKAFKKEHILWIGRLPDNVPAGTVTSEEEAAAMVERALKHLFDAKELLFQELTAAHLEVTQDATPAGLSRLVTAAGAAMRIVWEIWMNWSEATVQVCNSVRVLISTVDTGMKAAAGLLQSSVLVNKLLKDRPPTLLLLDEVQRCRVWQLMALTLCHRTVVTVGDRLQELPDVFEAHCRSGEDFFAEDTEDEEEEEGHQAREARPDAQTRYAAHLWAFDPNRFTSYKLTGCKRCGDPLVSFLRAAYSPDLAGFAPSQELNLSTAIVHVRYTTNQWLAMGWDQPVCRAPGLQASHIATAVVWAPRLFAALLVQVARGLRFEELKSFENGEELMADTPVIFVGFALQRLHGPFQLLVEAALAWPPFREAFGLRMTGAGNVGVRMASDTTGPTYRHGHVVTHRRYVTRERPDGFLGLQGDRNLLYVQMTRCTDSVTVWLEDGSVSGPTVRHGKGRRQQAFLQTRLQTARHMGLPILHLNLDADLQRELSSESLLPFERPPKPQWVASSLEMIDWLPRNQWLDLVQATGLATAPSVATMLGALPSHPLLGPHRQTIRTAGLQGHGVGRVLRSFGKHSWPTDLHKAGMDIMELRRLSGGITDSITVSMWGSKDFQIAVPVCKWYVDRLRWDDKTDAPGAQDGGITWIDAEGCPALRSLVSLIWALYTKACSPHHIKLTQVSRLHKAKLAEDRDDKEVIYVFKTCQSDREAVTLAPKEDAETVAREASSNGAMPRFSKDWYLYAYWGGGVTYQPDEVVTIVIKVKDKDLAAAALLVLRWASVMWGARATIDPSLMVGTGEVTPEDLMRDLETMAQKAWLPLPLQSTQPFAASSVSHLIRLAKQLWAERPPY